MQEGVFKYYSKRNLVILTILFLFTTFSGALRKWGINSNIVGNVILAIQLTVPFCVGLCIGIKPALVPTNKMFALLLIYFIYLVFAASNSMNRTIFHGISGVIIHLGFWFAVYTYINNRAVIPIEKLLNAFSIIAILEILLAFVQYSLPAGHILNRYVKADDGGIAMVGTAVRVTGTFSYISGFTGFIILMTFVICAFIKLNRKPLIVTITMALTLMACFISGSRGITVFFIIIVMGYIILSYKEGKGAIYLVQIILITLLAIVLNATLSDPLKVEEQVEESYENFESRVTSNRSEGESRFFLPVTEIFTYEGDIPFLGIGLGACYQGANNVFGRNAFFDQNGEGEVETLRTMIEGGPLLLMFKVLLLIALISHLKIDKRFTLLVCLMIIFTAPIVYNIYNAFYMFLGLMMLDKISFLEEEENLKKEEGKRKKEVGGKTIRVLN
jgi:hypothetical protein